MIQFAVQTPADVALKNGLARWVLAVDPVGERFLVTNNEREFTWVPIDECRYIKMINPAAPLAVYTVRVVPKSGLVQGNPDQMPGIN